MTTTNPRKNAPFKGKITYLPHGKSWYITAKLPREIHMTQELYYEIWDMHPETRARGKIFGKDIDFPRWHESFGETYFFNGMNQETKPIEHPYLCKLMEWVKKHQVYFFRSGKSQNYQQLLINWYGNGDDYIGAHSDSETQIVQNSPIYSFSFGQERDFVIKSNDKTYRNVIKMKHNTLIIMGGEMQKYYKHSVPKRAKSKCPGTRINITMRLFK